MIYVDSVVRKYWTNKGEFWPLWSTFMSPQALYNTISFVKSVEISTQRSFLGKEQLEQLFVDELFVSCTRQRFIDVTNVQQSMETIHIPTIAAAVKTNLSWTNIFENSAKIAEKLAF